MPFACCTALTQSESAPPHVIVLPPAHTAGGNSLTIKVARSGQTQQQCVENVLAAIKAALDKVPRKWDGVQVRCLPDGSS